MAANIWPVLTAGANSPHEFVAWAEGPQLAIRRGNWKLVLNGVTHDGTPEGNKPLQGEDAVFLSNLEEDPGESRNCGMNILNWSISCKPRWSNGGRTSRRINDRQGRSVRVSVSGTAKMLDKDPNAKCRPLSMENLLRTRKFVR